MRLAFLDEAGTSKFEPVAVVCGVLVDGNKQQADVEEHLEMLVKKNIPEVDQEGFSFHLTELWSGSGYFKDKNKWPLKLRVPIMMDLSNIPQTFSIPILSGFSVKEDVPTFEIKPGVKLNKEDIYHAVAFADSCAALENTCGISMQMSTRCLLWKTATG